MSVYTEHGDYAYGAWTCILQWLYAIAWAIITSYTHIFFHKKKSNNRKSWKYRHNCISRLSEQSKRVHIPFTCQMVKKTTIFTITCHVLRGGWTYKTLQLSNTHITLLSPQDSNHLSQKEPIKHKKKEQVLPLLSNRILKHFLEKEF